MRSALEILKQVFESITANKLRSFLTMFGIAWGVASLLLLIGLGEGFRSGQRRSLATLGTDIIFLNAGTIPALPGQHNGGRPYHITLADCAAIRRAPHVRDVTALIIRGDLKETSEFSSFAGGVWGVESNVQKIRTIPLSAGPLLRRRRRHPASPRRPARLEGQRSPLHGPSLARRLHDHQRPPLPGGRRRRKERARQQ